MPKLDRLEQNINTYDVKDELNVIIDGVNENGVETDSIKQVEVHHPPLLNGFTGYGPSYQVTIRKVNNVVNVTGGMNPRANASSISGLDGVIAFVVPVNMRPNSHTNTVCHGSGKNYWLSQINPSTGDFRVSRYNGTAMELDWLTFNITYIID